MSIAGNEYGEVLRPVSPAVLQVPQDLGLEVFLPGIPFDALRCGQKVRKDSSVFRGADIRVKPPDVHPCRSGISVYSSPITLFRATE